MIRALGALLLWTTLVSQSLAALAIDRAIIEFETGKGARQDVMARNTGDTNLFLEIEVLEVTNPGTDEEQRTVVRDPESIGFIAAPRRLMVPPGESRPVRLVNLIGHGDVERVYRVNIRPVVPPAETKGMGVRIVVAYQVLVFVAPLQTRVELNTTRNGNLLTFRNSGNVNIMLGNGEQCPMLGAKDCEELQGKRLYPGNIWAVELPGNGPVEFDVEADGSRQRQRF